MIHAPMDEIKRVIGKHIIKLPSSVANMKMSDFLREHGGSITAANEYKKNAARYVGSFIIRMIIFLTAYSLKACKDDGKTSVGDVQVRQRA